MEKYLVDSHCHLNYPGLYEDISGVISEANEKGVKVLQTICTKMNEVEILKNIARNNSNVFYSVGVHPLYSHESKIVTAAELIELVESDRKIIGIGETGLDYYKASDEDVLKNQRESFDNHISAAQITDVPLIIHTRDAEIDTYEILSKNMIQSKFSGVLHCFTGSIDLAMKAVDLGLYISASGIITFKNADEIREVFKELPLEKILIETDSPFLAPVPYRGKTNRPSYVVEVARFLSEIRSVSLDEIVESTTRNFHTLFKRAEVE
jgi:TatD DNase family protein